jgi:hypothetical protein
MEANGIKWEGKYGRTQRKAAPMLLCNYQIPHAWL